MQVNKLAAETSITTVSDVNIQKQLALSAAYLSVNTDSARMYAQTSLRFATKLGLKPLIADSYLALGESYDYVNQQTVALECFLKALCLYEELKLDSGLAGTYYSIGEMYNTLNEQETANLYFHKSLHIFSNQKYEFQMANLYGSLANSFYKAKHLDSATYYNNLALPIGKKYQDSLILMDILGNMTDVYIAKGQLDKAKDYLLQSYAIANSMGHYYCLAYAKRQFAQIALLQHEYPKAIQMANEVASIAHQLNMDDLLMDAIEVKYQTYKKIGKTDSALLFMEMFKALSDTLVGKKKYQSMDSLLNDYRLAKEQQQLQLLKQTNNSKKVLLTYSFFALAITGCFLFYLYRRSKERQKTTVQLQDQARKLNALNQLKDKMFSIIGHDLRGPVASLKGLVDFMKAESLSADESAMIVRELKQSVNGVDMLLENLLVWAKMQMEGNIVSKPELIDADALIGESLQLYQKTAAEKKILLDKKLEAGLHVFADRNYLWLIIRNLINNAIKFTPIQGQVSIEASEDGNKIKLCVIDNGIGMSKAEIDKLFNLEKPFTKRGTMNEKGSGLGLLFVKEYTERCGGIFSITSTEGKGSKFCITLAKG